VGTANATYEHAEKMGTKGDPMMSWWLGLHGPSIYVGVMRQCTRIDVFAAAGLAR
jgi:hypothetical protein